MPAFKAVYEILIFALFLYLLIYGFIVRKLFVVKIYFENKNMDNILLQKDSAFDSTFSDKQLSSGVELSSWDKPSLRNLVGRIPETLDNAKGGILSFLQDLGVKVNEAEIIDFSENLFDCTTKKYLLSTLMGVRIMRLELRENLRAVFRDK